MPGINPATTIEGTVRCTYSSAGRRYEVAGLQEALAEFWGKRVVVYIEEAGEPEGEKGQ